MAYTYLSQDISNINTLAGLFPNANANTGKTEISALKSNLDTLNSKLNSDKIYQNEGISKQQEIQKIIRDENQRLIDKKDTIDKAIISQNRNIFFNDNSRKIYSAYLRILIVLTITLAILWIIMFIRKYLEDNIPSWIFDILIIATISIGLIIIYYYYKDISIRNRYNFDEINLDPPSTDNTDASNKSVSSDLTAGAFNLCVNGDCCSDGTVWDEESGKCQLEESETSPFTTMTSIKPNEAFEYNEYAPYK